jgi:hypothetical protein
VQPRMGRLAMQQLRLIDRLRRLRPAPPLSPTPVIRVAAEPGFLGPLEPAQAPPLEVESARKAALPPCWQAKLLLPHRDPRRSIFRAPWPVGARQSNGWRPRPHRNQLGSWSLQRRNGPERSVALQRRSQPGLRRLALASPTRGSHPSPRLRRIRPLRFFWNWPNAHRTRTLPVERFPNS